MARRIVKLSVEELRKQALSLKNTLLHLHLKDGRVFLAKPENLDSEPWHFRNSFGHLLLIYAREISNLDYEISSSC